MLQFKKSLPIIVASFALGIAWNELKLDWNIFGIVWIIILMVGGGFFGRKILLWVLLGSVFFSLGFMNNEKHQRHPSEQTIDYYVNLTEGVNLRGYVSEFSDVRNNYTLLTISTKQIGINDLWQEVSGKVLVTTRNYPEYKLGDWLEAKCVLQVPVVFEDFDYRAYLAKNDIYTTCYFPPLSATEPENLTGMEDMRLRVMSNLNLIRQNFLSSVVRIFPEPSASFLSGILVGARQNISTEIKDDFKLTGLSHILAISGMHVAILTGFLVLLLGGIPRWIRFGLIAGILVVFALLVGASASVVRAVIMGIVTLLALTNFRQSNTFNALCLAGLLLLIFNPKLLIFDIGFQLSFLAVSGIVWFYNPLLIKLKKVVKINFVWEIVAMTLSAQALTLPVVAWNFGTISLISPVANVLVLPILPFLMLCGFLSGVLGIFSVFVAKLLGFFGWLASLYVFSVAKICAFFPYVTVPNESRSFWLICGYYLIFGGLVVYWKYKSSFAKNKGGKSGEAK